MDKIEQYKKVIFQLDELIRHILLDSNDLNTDCLKYWIDYWSKIEEENQDIFNGNLQK